MGRRLFFMLGGRHSSVCSACSPGAAIPGYKGRSEAQRGPSEGEQQNQNSDLGSRTPALGTQPLVGKPVSLT